MSPANKIITILVFVVLGCLTARGVDGGRVLVSTFKLDGSLNQFQTSSQSKNVTEIEGQNLEETSASCDDKQETKVCITRTVVRDVYKGATAIISIHKSQVSQNQSSSARISIKTTGSEDVEHIEAGLMVNPLNGDGMPRVYVSWTGKDSCSSCYNLDCPGFVRTKEFSNVNIMMSPVSQPDGTQYDIFFKISMDNTTGDWWLKLHNESTTIGHWPSKLFDKLGVTESSIDWGGEVHYLKNSGSPQMGSGLLPDEGFRRAAYIRNITYIDENYNTPSIADNSTLVSQYSDSNGCYGIGNHMSPYVWGYNFFYGGPGLC